MVEIQKTLDQIALDITEPEYRAMPELSYSTLARYEKEGYDKLDTLFDQISTPSLTEGSMVDCLITGSKEEFDEQFYVADFPSIGDKEKLVADYLFDSCHLTYSTMEGIPATYILDAANTYEFQKNWKDETRVRVLTERCSSYYIVKTQAGNRTVVSMDTFYKIQAMVRALRESPATSGYFADDDEMSPVRRYYQLKFKAVLDGVGYRCMADLIVVDYEKKNIYLTDLKTSSKPEWDFFKSFVEWKYAIQARLYYRIIAANLAKDEYFKDFKVSNYRFIVVNRHTLKPLVWEYRDTKEIGELTYGKNKQIVFRDPFTIGKELRGYLDCRPEVPNGITAVGHNDIVEHLEKM